MVDKREFTHYGLLYGVVPVYLSRVDTDCPDLVERHWSLIPLMWLCEQAFGLYCLTATAVNPEFEPAFPITITGEIDGG